MLENMPSLLFVDKDVFPTFSFGCVDSDSPGSTGWFKTDFLSETRFDKVSVDSGEEDFFASRLAGSPSSSVARPTKLSLIGTWPGFCASPSGDSAIYFSGAKSPLLSLNCRSERSFFIRWASFIAESFSPIPTKRRFPREEASRIGCLFDYFFFSIVFNAFLIQKRLVRLSRDFGEGRVFECNVFS